MNGGKKPKDEGRGDRSFSVPSSEVGRGAGLDPDSQAVRDDVNPDDEAFRDRPNVHERDSSADDEVASIQRPPSDS